LPAREGGCAAHSNSVSAPLTHSHQQNAARPIYHTVYVQRLVASSRKVSFSRQGGQHASGSAIEPPQSSRQLGCSWKEQRE
jgi:hypothetical protein